MPDIRDTLAEREKTHGSFPRHSVVSQQIKRDLANGDSYGRCADFQLEALSMIAHKMARIVSGDPREIDHWHDIAGYATLVADLLSEGGE